MPEQAPKKRRSIFSSKRSPVVSGMPPIPEGPEFVPADLDVEKMRTGSLSAGPAEVAVTKEGREAQKEKEGKRKELEAENVRKEIEAEEAMRGRRL